MKKKILVEGRRDEDGRIGERSSRVKLVVVQRALANDLGSANYRDRFLRVFDCDMTAGTFKINSCQGDCAEIG